MKKAMRYCVLTGVSVLMLNSCMTAQSIDDAMKSWLGSTKDELLLEWGPPASTFDDGKGGEVWTYESYRQTGGYAYTNRRGQTYYRPPQEYSIVRQFYIDKDGLIYAYRWKGI